MNQSILRAILLGGLLGGALDLLFAVTFASYSGVPPSRVFQTIASGVLGNDAFVGDAGVSALGIACHFGLSLLWATLFAAAAWQYPALSSRPVVYGIFFGATVFLCMRLIVLPLSAYPRPVTFRPLATALDLMSHMFLFGVPIAVMVSRGVKIA